MKSTGTLFKPEMVNAILSGIKTQTRRLRGLEGLNYGYYRDRIDKVECRDGVWCFWEIGHGSSALPVFTAKCPWGGAGDELYVKETWRPVGPWECREDKATVQYRADLAYAQKLGWPKDFRIKTSDRRDKWHPSIFMPRWAARIVRPIISIRPERVQEIAEKDAKEEGIQAFTWCVPPNPPEQTVTTYGTECYYPKTEATAVKAFHRLWDSINAKGTKEKPGLPWSKGPWVWRIEWRNK